MRLTRKLLGAVARVAILAIVWSTVAKAQAGSGQPSITTFLSAVNSSDDEIKALNAEKTVTANDIHLVNVAKISNAGNSATIAKAIAKNAGQIGEMREQAFEGRDQIVVSRHRIQVRVVD